MLARPLQAADDREAELRRSLRDAESKHKQQVAQLDASVHDLQRYHLLHTSDNLQLAKILVNVLSPFPTPFLATWDALQAWGFSNCPGWMHSQWCCHNSSSTIYLWTTCRTHIMS